MYCFFGSAFFFFFLLLLTIDRANPLYTYTTPLSVATLANQSSCKREPHLNVGGSGSSNCGGEERKGDIHKE